jgi:hypothetical protein
MLLNQDTYLNGSEKWEGQTSPVFYYFIRKVRSTILGSIPFMGEKKGSRRFGR